MTTQFEADIEDILRDRFPSKALAEALAPISEAAALMSNGTESAKAQHAKFASRVAEIEAARAEYRAMSATYIAQLAEASRRRIHQRAAQERARQAAAKERERFYCKPDAAADFLFWCKVDFWTVDEAAALLLSRDPRRVNPTALDQELAKPAGVLGGCRDRTKFHDDFDGLRTRLSRASELQVEQLKPATVVGWAQRVGIRLPAGLMPLATAQASVSISPVEPNPGGPQTVAAKEAKGTGKAWTPDRVAALRAFHAEHGTKAASKKFEISPQRVRQVLSQDKARSRSAQQLNGLIRSSR